MKILLLLITSIGLMACTTQTRSVKQTAAQINAYKESIYGTWKSHECEQPSHIDYIEITPTQYIRHTYVYVEEDCSRRPRYLRSHVLNYQVQGLVELGNNTQALKITQQHAHVLLKPLNRNAADNLNALLHCGTDGWQTDEYKDISVCSKSLVFNRNRKDILLTSSQGLFVGDLQAPKDSAGYPTSTHSKRYKP